MAQSNAERQAGLRERMAMLGMREVRGLYLPPLLHAALKAHAKKLLKRRDAETMRNGLRKYSGEPQ
jgi:hypothetical protein